MSQGRFGSCRDFGWTRRKGEERGLEECCEQKYTTGVFMACEATDVYEFGGSTEWALLDEVGWFAGAGWMRPDRSARLIFMERLVVTRQILFHMSTVNF